MPLCHDREKVRPLLLRDEPATRSVYNLLFGVAGGAAGWVRVDDCQNPHAVLVRNLRSTGLVLYADRTEAARQVLAELPARRRPWFAATPWRFVRLVAATRRITWQAPCFYYVLRDREKLVIHRKQRVGRLTVADAPVVTKYWPHGRQEGYVRERIRQGPTCAIRVKGRLVAWALTHDDGAMGMLHVLDEYRGQGMARTITTTLAERCLRAGLKPFLYILTGNRASICLTESMGFERYGRYGWFGT